jgi:hypothetical protein
MDAPLGPAMAARGHENVVKRLKGAFENEKLSHYTNEDRLILTNGVDVIYTHLETFTSANGEVSKNHIGSVHKLVDNKVTKRNAGRRGLSE